jgi:hypothetical protein
MLPIELGTTNVRTMALGNFCEADARENMRHLIEQYNIEGLTLSDDDMSEINEVSHQQRLILCACHIMHQHMHRTQREGWRTQNNWYSSAGSLISRSTPHHWLRRCAVAMQA